MLRLFKKVGQALAYEAQDESRKRNSMEIDCDQASDVISKHIKDIYFKASITTVETPRKDVPPKGIKGRIGGKGEIKKKVNMLLVLQKFLWK